jgi:bacterial/archaeal transporter family protein
MTWFVYVVLSALTTSLSAIFDKVAIKEADSTLTATVYAIITALFLVSFSLLFKKIGNNNLQTLSINSIFFILLSGTVYGLSWLFYLNALKHGPLTKVAITDTMSLLFTTLLSALLLGECLHMRQLIGAVLITIGTYLVAVTI